MPGRRLAGLGGGLVTTLVVLGAALAVPGAAGAAPPDRAPTAVRAEPSARTACPAAVRGFRPTGLRVPGVVDRKRVLAVGRDRYGTPRTPPLTARGRWQLGWDRAGNRPGGRYGVVRLNAHTYPRSGAHGLALGNRLLARLRVGHRIVVTGSDGQRVCYRVTRRVVMRAERRPYEYYANSGRSRLAILVCSGKRRGPGNWSHRTIWFAKRVTS